VHPYSDLLLGRVDAVLLAAPPESREAWSDVLAAGLGREAAPLAAEWLPLAAECSGVPVIQPVPWASSSAPRATSKATASACPKNAAKCSGVKPSPLRASTPEGSVSSSAVSRSRSPNVAASKMSRTSTCAFTAAVMPRSKRYRACIRAETPVASRDAASPGSRARIARTRSTSPSEIAVKRSSEVLAISLSSHYRLYLLRLST